MLHRRIPLVLGIAALFISPPTHAQEKGPRAIGPIEPAGAAPKPNGKAGGKAPAQDLAAQGPDTSFEQVAPFLKGMMHLTIDQGRLVLDRAQWEKALAIKPGHPYAVKVKELTEEEKKDKEEDIREANAMARGKVGGVQEWRHILKEESALKKLFARAGRAVLAKPIGVAYTSVVNKKGVAKERKIGMIKRNGKKPKEFPKTTYYDYTGGDQRHGFFKGSNFEGYLFEENNHVVLEFKEKASKKRSLRLEDNGKGALRILLTDPTQARSLVINQRAQGKIECILLANGKGQACAETTFPKLVLAHSDLWTKQVHPFLAEFAMTSPPKEKISLAKTQTPTVTLPENLKSFSTYAKGFGKLIRLTPQNQQLALDQVHWQLSPLLVPTKPIDVYKTKNGKPRVVMRNQNAEFSFSGNDLNIHFRRFGQYFVQFTPRILRYGLNSKIRMQMLYESSYHFHEQGLWGHFYGLYDNNNRLPIPKETKVRTSRGKAKALTVDLLFQEQLLWGDTLSVRFDELAGHTRLLLVNAQGQTLTYFEQFPNGQAYAVTLGKLPENKRAHYDTGFPNIYRKARSYFDQDFFPACKAWGIGHFNIYTKDVETSVLSKIWVKNQDEIDALEDYLDMLDSEDIQEKHEALTALKEAFYKYRKDLETAKDNPEYSSEVIGSIQSLLSTKTKALAKGDALVKTLGLQSDIPYFAYLLGKPDPLLKKAAQAALEKHTGQKLGADPKAWRQWFSQQK